MRKKKKGCSCKKKSVGMLPSFSGVSIPDVVLETLLTGGETIVGFMAAEGLANWAGTISSQAATSNGRLVVKSIASLATGVSAFIWPEYQKHLLILAGGMAGNALATGVKNQLPAQLQALVPGVAGFSRLQQLNRQTSNRFVNQGRGEVLQAI